MIEGESFYEAVFNLASAFVAAFMGRLTKHILMVQRGLRNFCGIHLLLELPVAIFMGFVGDGVADWLALSSRESIGVIAALSYLGPATIEYVFAKYISRDVLDDGHKR